MNFYGDATIEHIENHPDWVCWECDHPLNCHKGENYECQICQRCRIPDIPTDLKMVKVGQILTNTPPSNEQQGDKQK